MTAQTILPANSVTGSYDVDNSLRFNFGSSDYLNLTAAGNSTLSTKGTWSTWVKKSTISSSRGALFSGYADASNRVYLVINADAIFLFGKVGGTVRYTFQIDQFSRDPSAWMNIVVAIDTTQGTNTNRIKMYINGVLQGDIAANPVYPVQDSAIPYAATNSYTNLVGAVYSTSISQYLDGYLAETVFVDGLALNQNSFGQFDSASGIWQPKNVSGLTFGDNGFYLEYKGSGTSANASGLGADTSGNTSHFTVNNLTAVDQSTDTCTNNFATLNPSNVPVANKPTFAEGNLKTTSGTTGQAYMGSATIGVASGKWYAEMKVKVIDSMIGGVSANVSEDARDSTYPGQQDDSVGILFASGNKYIDDNGTTHGDAFNANDILMIALDLDNNRVYFGRNGNWFDGSGNADESNPNSALALTAPQYTQDGFYFFSVGDGGGSAAAAAEWNFGSPMYAISSSNADADGHGNFEYAVPSGYFALCTKNLAEYG
jgi:hypothetical protein